MITILPFYVKKLSHSSEHDITIALLLLYLSSIITSALTKKILSIMGPKWILTLGFALSITASMILLQAFNTVFETYFIFLATFVVGIAQAIILNSVINFICEVIGANGLKGGFVFG
jgi:Na+/melibiose symporter-like transporter